MGGGGQQAAGGGGTIKSGGSYIHKGLLGTATSSGAMRERTSV